jgi:hypothetical protein
MCVGGFIFIGMCSLECRVYSLASIPIAHIIFCTFVVVLPVRTNIIFTSVRAQLGSMFVNHCLVHSRLKLYHYLQYLLKSRHCDPDTHFRKLRRTLSQCLWLDRSFCIL